MVNDHGQRMGHLSTVICRTSGFLGESRHAYPRVSCNTDHAIVVRLRAGANRFMAIVTSVGDGTINARTSREDLVRKYGAENVEDRDVDIGEGEMQSATFVFPKDPERRLEILWKDPDTKSIPGSVDIVGKKSRWHAAHGITLGTSASQLERLNGRPFHISLRNDGTDMREETISWRGGRLEKELQGNVSVILELLWAPSRKNTHMGPNDVEVNSDNLAWLTQSPYISRISWIYSSITKQ